jgi:hypothetical protein
VEDQPLAEQARKPRLTGVRLAKDEDVPAANGERELTAIFSVPKYQPSSRQRDRRDPPCRRDSPDEVGDRHRSGAADDEIGGGT